MGHGGQHGGRSAALSGGLGHACRGGPRHQGTASHVVKKCRPRVPSRVVVFFTVFLPVLCPKNTAQMRRIVIRKDLGPFLYLSPGRLDVDAVDLGRRVLEHRCAFGRRVSPGEPFERVVHDVIGKGELCPAESCFQTYTALDRSAQYSTVSTAPCLWPVPPSRWAPPGCASQTPCEACPGRPVSG